MVPNVFLAGGGIRRKDVKAFRGVLVGLRGSPQRPVLTGVRGDEVPALNRSRREAWGEATGEATDRFCEATGDNGDTGSFRDEAGEAGTTESSCTDRGDDGGDKGGDNCSW